RSGPIWSGKCVVTGLPDPCPNGAALFCDVLMDYLAFPLDCRIGLCGSAYVRAAFSPEFISDVIGHLGAVAKNADGVFAVFIDHLSGEPDQWHRRFRPCVATASGTSGCIFGFFCWQRPIQQLPFDVLGGTLRMPPRGCARHQPDEAPRWYPRRSVLIVFTSAIP